MDNLVVILGIFHLITSFLGSIGYIMAGSSIDDLFATVYAENTIKHLLSGHAFDRAMRAHAIAFIALGKLICQDSAPDKHTQFKGNFTTFSTGNKSTCQAGILSSSKVA